MGLLCSEPKISVLEQCFFLVRDKIGLLENQSKNLIRISSIETILIYDALHEFSITMNLKFDNNVYSYSLKV